MVQLSVGDSFTIPTASATDIEDGDLTSSIDFNNGGLNTSVEGTYILTWTVDDSDGNQGIKSITVEVTAGGEPGGEYTGYYASIDGLSGTALTNELYTLLNNTGTYTTTTYDQASTILTESDRWVGFNTNYIYLIYTNTHKGSVNDGYPDEGYAVPVWNPKSYWNREHVWAKSLFGTGSYPSISRGIAADIHNLRAADTNVNSTRGNNKFLNQIDYAIAFGNVGSQWYPGDDHRGDVARIIFYMDIRWGNDTHISNIGDLATFKAWHEADPVDAFEINRNNVIYGYQHNRNPFIDHPELVNMIYS